MAKGMSGMRGAKQLIQNLHKEASRRRILSAKGLLAAATFIRADMDRVIPLIPIDTGDLKSSWFTSLNKDGKQVFVQMGFTASYAVIVHEDMRKKNWTRPGSGPKFFESALRRNYAKILMIIANELTSSKAPSFKVSKKKK